MRTPPDGASLAVIGAADNGDEVHLHFEGLPDKWWVSIGKRFHTLGIVFSVLPAQIVGVDDYPGWTDPWKDLLPLPPGSTVLTMAYAMAGKWDPNTPSRSIRPKFTFQFYDPVKDFSMVIYPENDSDLTCYDREGRIVGAAAATGVWSGQAVTLPFVAQTLRVTGPGIVRCDLDAMGGAIDDIRFRRSSNDLNLECNGDLGRNRVTRGEELNCQVSGASPQDNVEIESWGFRGADSRGEPYQFPGEMDGPITDNPWSGRMAIGGTVSVRARVNGGQFETVSAEITVVGRNWSNHNVAHSVRRISLAEFNSIAPFNQRVPAVPTQHSHTGGMGAQGIFLGSADGIFDFITDSGPNHGLAMYNRVPVELDLGVMVHPEMENQGVFFKRHPVANGGGGNFCVQNDFPAYVQLILAHEGMPLNAQSHTGVYLREYVRRAGPAVEDVAFPNDALERMSTVAEQRLAAVSSQADQVSDSEVDGNHQVPFPCNFKWR